MKIRLRFSAQIAGIVITIVFGSLLLNNQLPSTVLAQQSDSLPAYVDLSQEVVIRLYYDNQTQLNRVAGYLDIWEVHPLPASGSTAGYAVVSANSVQRTWLIAQGYRVELDLEKNSLLQAPLAVLDPRYYYFDSYVNNPNNRYMVDFLPAINLAYPDLTELLDVGDAWLTSHGGHARNILVLRISNEDPQYGDIAEKPAFFMMANIHAREVTTPEMAIRYIKYLTEGYNGEGGYGIDPDVTWLVDYHATYVMLSVNPDGRVKNEQNSSQYWRKNVDSDDGCLTAAYGVDINRNSNFYWGWDDLGSSSDPCDETFRGPAAGSEPETVAFQDFAASIFQDWNGNNGDYEVVTSPLNASGIFLTLHSYADDILWPFGFANGTAPNNAELETIGRKLADITGVMLPSGGIGYPVNGSSDDWIYGKLGIAAFTYEIGPNSGSCGNFFPDFRCQDGLPGVSRNFWREMKASFVYINKIAATPYITAYGLDVQNLSAIAQADPSLFDLSGTVLDQRYGGDPLKHVMAAEYFIDAPGSDGAGFSMSPSDGNWGSTSEAVEALVDASGLGVGRHYLLVHGRNENNVWGPYTAVFIDVVTPAYGLNLEPTADHAQADPGQTITYHLQLENSGSNTDSYALTANNQWDMTMPATIGPLAPGERASFDVVVSVPLDAINGESDVATLTATSQSNLSVSDHTILTSTANFYDFSLVMASPGGNGYPGGKLEYTLQITNTGNVADNYAFQVLSSNWKVDVPLLIGPVANGETVSVPITVHVPRNISMGDDNDATLAVSSQGNAISQQVYLHTDTFWYTTFVPFTQKH